MRPAATTTDHPAATLLDLPQQFLNFLPLPQGQGSLRPTFWTSEPYFLLIRTLFWKR